MSGGNKRLYALKQTFSLLAQVCLPLGVKWLTYFIPLGSWNGLMEYKQPN